jgi:hypothetical protein
MPVRVGSSEGLGSTVCGGQSRDEMLKHTGIAFAYWTLMRQRGELAPTFEPAAIASGERRQSLASGGGTTD